jgi:hypothetical protein
MGAVFLGISIRVCGADPVVVALTRPPQCYVNVITKAAHRTVYGRRPYTYGLRYTANPYTVHDIGGGRSGRYGTEYYMDVYGHGGVWYIRNVNQL